MKCAQCNKEIVLARACPYCGHRSGPVEKADGRSRHTSSGGRTRGIFRGPVSRAERRTDGSPFRLIPAMLRYFSDPNLARWRKVAIVVGFLYVISPFDLVPGAMVPVVGWLDDAVVAALTWRLLCSELARHKQK